MKSASVLWKTAIVAVVFAAFGAPVLSASEVAFEMNLDSNIVAIGETVTLSLTFEGGQDVPPPELKEIDGFQVRYAGQSKMVSITNGRVSNSITHNYLLLPLRVGIFPIGPFVFDYRQNRYTSNRLQLKVVEGSQARSMMQNEPLPLPGLEDQIFLVLKTDMKAAYLNQLIPVTIKLYINRVSVREAQYPVFAQEGFSKAEFAPPKQYRESMNGIVYEVVEFTTKVFGTKTGEFTLGPASMKVVILARRSGSRRSRMLDEDGFIGGNPNDPFYSGLLGEFERTQVELKSKDVAVKVLPLPKEGMPPNFSGTVGDYQFIFDVAPRQVKVGDPVTLKAFIYGAGNYNAISAPVLESAKGFKVYEPRPKVEDNRKSFEQVVIPESETVTEIPRVSFTFFNPKTVKYETITHGPTPITVQKSPEGSKPRIVESPSGQAGPKEPVYEELGRDIIYIKDSPGDWSERGAPVYAKRWFQAVQSIPLLLLLLVIALHARSERLRTDLRYARKLRAPAAARQGIGNAERSLKEANAKEFYDTVHTTLREYLGDRFHLATGGITSQVIDEVLRPANFDEEALKKLGALFAECDLARYAGSGIGPDAMRATLASLREVIHYFERVKR